MKKCHSVEQRSPLCKVGVIQHVLVDPRIGSFQAWLNTLWGFIRELNGRLLKYIKKKCGALFSRSKETTLCKSNQLIYITVSEDSLFFYCFEKGDTGSKTE